MGYDSMERGGEKKMLVGEEGEEKEEEEVVQKEAVTALAVEFFCLLGEGEGVEKKAVPKTYNKVSFFSFCPIELQLGILDMWGHIPWAISQPLQSSQSSQPQTQQLQLSLPSLSESVKAVLRALARRNMISSQQPNNNSNSSSSGGRQEARLYFDDLVLAACRRRGLGPGLWPSGAGEEMSVAALGRQRELTALAAALMAGLNSQIAELRRFYRSASTMSTGMPQTEKSAVASEAALKEEKEVDEDKDKRMEETKEKSNDREIVASSSAQKAKRKRSLLEASAKIEAEELDRLAQDCKVFATSTAQILVLLCPNDEYGRSAFWSAVLAPALVNSLPQRSSCEENEGHGLNGLEGSSATSSTHISNSFVTASIEETLKRVAVLRILQRHLEVWPTRTLAISWSSAQSPSLETSEADGKKCDDIGKAGISERSTAREGDAQQSKWPYGAIEHALTAVFGLFCSGIAKDKDGYDESMATSIVSAQVEDAANSALVSFLSTSIAMGSTTRGGGIESGSSSSSSSSSSSAYALQLLLERLPDFFSSLSNEPSKRLHLVKGMCDSYSVNHLHCE
jgi:hypothetical protein